MPEVRGRSLWQDAWQRLLQNRAALASVVILLLITLMIIFAPYLSPYEYDETDWDLISSPPST